MNVAQIEAQLKIVLNHETQHKSGNFDVMETSKSSIMLCLVVKFTVFQNVISFTLCCPNLHGCM